MKNFILQLIISEHKTDLKINYIKTYEYCIIKRGERCNE